MPDHAPKRLAQCRNDAERVVWALNKWHDDVPQRAAELADLLAPLLIKVHDGRQLTSQDRALASLALHEVHGLTSFTRTVTSVFDRATTTPTTTTTTED